MKKTKKVILIILGSIGVLFIQFLLLFGFMYLSFATAKIKVNTDISKYNEYIGENAKEDYKNKWDMNENIFPDKITNNMRVEDYKTVYYNPWDAQYLSYLIINYNAEDYKKEVNRLKNYNSTDYIGYYTVTGFSKYTLLAIEADSYHGFVYATTDGKNKIIYVEIIFCNYYMDINYKEYINNDFLPDGFDATLDNPYLRTKMREQ